MSASSVARRMTAGEQLRAGRNARRVPQLLVGLVGYGISVTFLVQSGLGASSWSVLAEGVSERTGLSFGWATNLIAVAVLVFWIPLRELPGLGTLLNVLLVGLSADFAVWFLPPPDTLAPRFGYYLAGLLMLTFFDAVYLGARFGSGPRDGLMTGAVRVTGKPIWLVRTGIEVAVLTVGWFLGGTAGLGTLVIALAMGPLVQQFLRRTTVRLPGDDLDNTAKSG
ncbi:membrane protein YczE [Amycolatopsis magusensis]|uniref:membrane protein YczE n=1 Tax=Amycolatopsis magusensis TaxID=882444 RepID=UPI0037AE2B98